MLEVLFSEDRDYLEKKMCENDFVAHVTTAALPGYWYMAVPAHQYQLVLGLLYRIDAYRSSEGNRPTYTSVRKNVLRDTTKYSGVRPGRVAARECSETTPAQQKADGCVCSGYVRVTMGEYEHT